MSAESGSILARGAASLLILAHFLVSFLAINSMFLLCIALAWALSLVTSLLRALLHIVLVFIGFPSKLSTGKQVLSTQT